MNVNILIELKKESFNNILESLKQKGFIHDEEYGRVPMRGRNSVLIRGAVEENKMSDLKSISGVVGVWLDSNMEPFGPQ